MTRMTFFSLIAATGWMVTACEQHSASELAGEDGNRPAAKEQAGEGQSPQPEAPKAPTEVPTNPGGAAPVEKPASSPAFFPR